MEAQVESMSRTRNGALKAALERTERKAVERVLAQANGNVAEAAAKLGILRTSLYRIMKRYGIPVPSRVKLAPGVASRHN